MRGAPLTKFRELLGAGTPTKALRYRVDDPYEWELADEHAGMVVTRIDRLERTVDVMWASDYREYFQRPAQPVKTEP